jgi:hypothetical protein
MGTTWDELGYSDDQTDTLDTGGGGTDASDDDESVTWDELGYTDDQTDTLDSTQTDTSSTSSTSSTSDPTTNLRNLQGSPTSGGSDSVTSGSDPNPEETDDGGTNTGATDTRALSKTDSGVGGDPDPDPTPEDTTMSTTTTTGVDEVRNPDDQLRALSGAGDGTTATGSNILAAGGDLAGGINAVTGGRVSAGEVDDVGRRLLSGTYYGSTEEGRETILEHYGADAADSTRTTGTDVDMSGNDRPGGGALVVLGQAGNNLPVGTLSLVVGAAGLGLALYGASK